MRPIIDLRARYACAAGLAIALTYAQIPTDASAAVSGTTGASGAGAAAAPVPIAPQAPSAPWPISRLAPPRRGSHRALSYGQRFELSGDAGSAQAGAPLALQYRPAGSSTWRVLLHARVGSGGRYQLRARLARSGVLRVAVQLHGVAARLGTTGPLGARAFAAPADTSALSTTLPVRVRAGISAAPLVVSVLAGRRAVVRGSLWPRRAGRAIALQGRTPAGWSTVARTRTGARGRYRLAFTPRLPGSELLRVRFAGDGANAGSETRPGRLDTYRLAVASWYGGGGETACGQELNDGMLGVANKTLPCGTLVTLRYNGRSVRVPVIDRGPFVPGRDYDLTVATKEALGFPDLGVVWATA